jgi:hypothetical protein
VFMLGWHIFIHRRVSPATAGHLLDAKSALASWEAGIGGLDWIEALVEAGSASCLGGDGYPISYTARAADVISRLAEGPPKHNGPLVIGEDYVLPGGWVGNVDIRQTRLAGCEPDELLLIEAWDLS